MLCAVPALRALRGTSPRAQITLIGDPSAEWLLGRFHTYFNELIPFPGFPGMDGPEPDAREIAQFLSDAHERDFDLAVQLHDDGHASNAFTLLLGARKTAGAHPGGLPSPDGDLFVEYPTKDPEPVRLLRVLQNLGAHPPRGAEPELPELDSDREELAELLAGEELEPGRYACLHPGPGPAERFVAIGAAFIERGLRPVLLGGSEHAAVADAVADGLEPNALNLVGEVALGATSALLRDAAVMVGDGLSLTHLSAAVRTPSVTFPAPDVDVDRWRPQDTEHHRVLASDASPEDAVEAAGELIAEPSSGSPARR